MPPEYLHPLLHSIETVTILISEDFPKLSEKDVDYAYGQLKNYFDQKAKNKEVEEPISSSDRRQALMDDILNIIDVREAAKGDEHLVMNTDYKPGGRPIASLAQLYSTGFRYLMKSVSFWHKERGRKGYIHYISKSIPH